MNCREFLLYVGDVGELLNEIEYTIQANGGALHATRYDRPRVSGGSGASTTEAAAMRLEDAKEMLEPTRRKYRELLRIINQLEGIYIIHHPNARRPNPFYCASMIYADRTPMAFIKSYFRMSEQQAKAKAKKGASDMDALISPIEFEGLAEGDYIISDDWEPRIIKNRTV